MKALKINEIFDGIQGEGRYSGYPAVFIRLSGCNLKCYWCDTKYHKKVEYELTPEVLAQRIKRFNRQIVVWTGGEPMLQKNLIIDTIFELMFQYSGLNFDHHIETNGTILDNALMFNGAVTYICFSPKRFEDIEKIHTFMKGHHHYDIKVVTDGLTINTDMIPEATILMPITVEKGKFNKEIMQEVWKMALQHNKRLSLRLQTIVWNNKRGK